MRSLLPNFLSREETWLAAGALAAGLVVAWILRGAVPGQATSAEDDVDSPRSSYRDRMIAGVVVGLLLIALGCYLSVMRGILFSVPAFILGFGLVIFLIARNRRYRHASPTLRRTIDFSTAFLNASLLAGILIAGNVIAFRYAGQPREFRLGGRTLRYGGQPLDLTREGAYSLSTMTTKQIESLDRPVKFTLFFGQGPRASRQHDRMKQLLDSYKAINPDQIEIDYLDPFNDVTRYEELAKRAPELELLQGGGGVVIEYGGSESATHTVVRNQDLFLAVPGDPARQGRDRFASSFSGEDEVTTALIRLREGNKTMVGFTVGHGEPSTADLNPRGLGIGYWKSRFNKVGCEVVDLNLVSDEIPPELALLVIVGPKSPFNADEVTKLRSFTDRGRPLLLLLGNTDPSGLDDFLKSFNLSIGKGVIVDSKYSMRNDRSLVYAFTESALSHQIVTAMGPNRAVLLPAAAPIEIAGGAEPAGVDHSLVPTAILRTSASSWAETSLRAPLALDRGTDKEGPLAVGVAVSERPPQGGAAGSSGSRPRLVLFACPAMAVNRIQELERTNLDILMLAAGWLRGRSDTLGIPPHTHVALTLSADPQQRMRLIMVPSVVALMSIIAMGVIVFTARRE